MSVNFFIDEKIIASLRKAEAVLKGTGAPKLRAALVKGLGEFDTKQNREAFGKSEGSVSGQRWARLTPRYKKWKTKKVGRKNILTFRGNLRDSLTRVSGAGRHQRMRGKVVELGTTHRLAKFHQYGTKKMVARPPVRKSDRQVAELYKKAAVISLVAMGVAAGSGPLKQSLSIAAGRINPKANLGTNKKAAKGNP